MPKEPIKFFCECCDGSSHSWCREPLQVIDSIKTAKNELSYSNYDNANFDIAIKVIRRFCKDNKIPMRFKRKKITS